MSASTLCANPSFFKITAADGDKDRLDFACVITGYGMLIILSGLLALTRDMCGTHLHILLLCKSIPDVFAWTRICDCHGDVRQFMTAV